ncbi:MAG: sigma-70 family RNA polymerase sigma factor [Planctomycetota bacterium]
MNPSTSKLLTSWHSGETGALAVLIERHLDWIVSHVHDHLGEGLRAKAETRDFVQDAMVQLLTYGPRFHVDDDGRFRALVARIVENALRDKYDWFTARRRDVAREHPLPPDSVLELEPGCVSGETPSRVAQRHEREAWIRLGIELLDPEDREVIVLREWEGLSFAAIAERLGVTADGARMRFSRSVGRLARKVRALRRGQLPQALESTEQPHAPS